MKHQDKFKKKYGIDAIDFVEKADLEYFGTAKTLGIISLLKGYAQKKGINIEFNDEFNKDLVEAFAEAGKKFPYNEKIMFNKEVYQLEPTPVNPSIPKSKGVLEDFKDIVADDILRPQYNGVYVSENGYLYATDAHKLVKYKNNEYSEYENKLIDLKIFIASKGKKLDFIDARAPQYDSVIPKENPNIVKGLPTYNFYNLSKSVIALSKLQNSNVFSIIFDFKGQLFGFNPFLMNDLLNFALCKGFDTFTFEYSTPNRGVVFKFDNESLGLLMPVMLKDDSLLGTTTLTIEQIVSDYGYSKSMPKAKSQKATKVEVKEVPYKKFEGSMNQTTYVPRRDISYLVLRNGEQLSGNDIIDGVYKIKKMAKGGGVGDSYNIKNIKIGDRIKDKYNNEAEVWYNDGEKIDAQYVSGASYVYRQKDFDNGEVRFLWADRNIMKTGGGVGNKMVAFPEELEYKYFVVDEDNDNYLTVQEDMFDKWKNANKTEKAEYYSEWIPKNEMIEVMAKGGGVGEIKFEELVGNKFSIKRGSGTKTTTWEKEDLLEEIKGVIKHELFDRDFYYNWTDEGREYSNIFDKYTLNPMLKDIDKTLNEYFVMKKYPNNHTLEFKEHSQGYIDNWFKTNSHISPTLRNDYKRYREKYAGITPYAKGGGVGEPYDSMTKYQLDKEYKKLNEKRDILKKKYGKFDSSEIVDNEKQIDKIITLLYGENFSGVGQKYKYADGGGVGDNLKIPNISVKSPEKIEKDSWDVVKNKMYKKIMYKVEIVGGNGTLYFDTEKEAKDWYNKIKNFKNMSELYDVYFEEVENMVKKENPSYSGYKKAPYKSYEIGSVMPFSAFQKIKPKTHLALTYQNGIKVDFIFDKIALNKAIGWLKFDNEWIYGDYIYDYEGNACIGSGANPLTLEKIVNTYTNGGEAGDKIFEIKAKIEKAKANKVMPEALKKQYIEKYENQLAALTLDKGTKEDVKDFLEVPKGKTPKIVKVEPKGRVKLKEILIHWAEGDNSKYDKFPKKYKTWEAANKAIIPIYEDYAEEGGGGYNKVKFTVTFDDNENYDGRLDVSTKEDNPTKTHNVIGQHIKDYLDYQLSEKSRTSETSKKEILEWLEKYDLGLEKGKEKATKVETKEKNGFSIEQLNSMNRAELQEAYKNKFNIYPSNQSYVPLATALYFNKRLLYITEKEIEEYQEKSKKSLEIEKETKENTKVSKNYDYIPQRDIEQIKSKQGTIENKDILDGAYVKKGWKHKK